MCSIKAGNFSKGWKLFDYGLITPADGPQRWQKHYLNHLTRKKLWF